MPGVCEGISVNVGAGVKVFTPGSIVSRYVGVIGDRIRIGTGHHFQNDLAYSETGGVFEGHALRVCIHAFHTGSASLLMQSTVFQNGVQAVGVNAPGIVCFPAVKAVAGLDIGSYVYESIIWEKRLVRLVPFGVLKCIVISAISKADIELFTSISQI